MPTDFIFKNQLIRTIDNEKKVVNKFINECMLYDLEKEKKLFLNYIECVESIERESQGKKLPPYYEKSISELLHIRQIPNLTPPSGCNNESNRDALISFSRQIESILNNLSIAESLKTLNYVRENTVLVGANGSGKSTLSNELSKLLQEKEGIVITSQKLLIVPQFTSFPNLSITERQYEKYEKEHPNPKSTFEASKPDDVPYHLMKSYGGEFHVILSRLISERISKQAEFCTNAKAQGKHEKQNQVKVNLENLNCTLETAFALWNNLIGHRTITCDISHNIVLNTNEQNYPGYLMSDGEKVLLYYIGRVLLAPKASLIVIDEPEMHLHRAITTKLWDALEKERNDCTFLYVTHDIEFAATRQASKYWIKSFTAPNKWEIEHIENNIIPEELLLNLLGSRKNILFCEGTINSLDKTVLEELFPNFTIYPVETCSNVINYTKAFNGLHNVLIRAYGIIDRDFRTAEEVSTLSKSYIFTHFVAEIENVFLIETFLSAFLIYMHEEAEKLETIKIRILEKLRQELDQQAFFYAQAKLRFLFTAKYSVSGKNMETLKQSYANFCNSVKIDDWFEERKNKLKEICAEKDYNKVLELYNHKGLKSIVEQILGFNDFHSRAVKFLRDKNANARQYLINHFPQQLVTAHGDVL